MLRACTTRSAPPSGGLVQLLITTPSAPTRRNLGRVRGNSAETRGGWGEASGCGDRCRP